MTIDLTRAALDSLLAACVLRTDGEGRRRLRVRWLVAFSVELGASSNYLGNY